MTPTVGGARDKEAWMVLDREKKVRRLLRKSGWGYIDRAAGIRRQAAGAKASSRQRDARNGHAKPEGGAIE